MTLPEWYIDWIERVSKIVEFEYPFDWDWQKRFKDWLVAKHVLEEDYMLESTTVGTFVHKQLENYLTWKPLDITDGLFNLHANEISFWKKYIRDLVFAWGDLYSEKTIIDKNWRYQGTIDLVRICEKTKTVWLYDWKTWWIAKKRWNMPNEIKKNPDKLKKVALQLSLYAETYRQKWYTIWGIYVVWLHEQELVEYNLFEEFHKQKVKNIRLWSTNEIESLLKRFENSWEQKTKHQVNWQHTLLFNRNPMKIEIQTPSPSNQYARFMITLDDKDIEGKHPEEAIDEAIRLQKLLLSKY